MFERLVLGAALALGFAAGGATQAAAQISRSLKPRLLTGTVTNNAGTALAGSVVYLKNTNTLAIKTYVADGSGAYHFGQLGTDADYQVWAEYGGRKSSVKTVSAMENKSNFKIALKIDTAK